MFSSLKHLSISRRLIGDERDRISKRMMERVHVRTGMGLYNTSINSTNWQTKKQERVVLF